MTGRRFPTPFARWGSGIADMALIATLERGLGPEFTPDVREAWLGCIAAIASEMLDAAREPA